MTKISYEHDWKPRADAVQVINQAELICAEYATQGFDLTLRQLYYQFVARGLIPNTMQSYKRLGDIIGKARMAGMLSWSYIVDRTRNLRGTSHWDTPGQIMRGAASSYRLDKWETQRLRIEVWVEKEALAGIVAQVARQYDVDYFSCRGYVSLSELWAAGQRHKNYILNGQAVLILHLGDHDPSGIDMTRDIRDRLTTFIGYRAYENLDVRRIALNMDQIEQYGPPPNPAKLTDSRANGYVDLYGYDSWELDALDPATLAALIGEHIERERDDREYHTLEAREERERELLTEAADRWSELVEYLGGNDE